MSSADNLQNSYTVIFNSRGSNVVSNNTAVACQFLGTYNGTVLTVTTIISGQITLNTTLNVNNFGGTNTNTGLVITSFGTGTGGTGTYNLSGTPTAATVSFTATTTNGSNIITVTGITSGTIAIGQTVTGTSILNNTTIIALGTGLGGTGTYTLSANASAAAAAGIAMTATPLYLSTSNPYSSIVYNVNWGSFLPKCYKRFRGEFVFKSENFNGNLTDNGFVNVSFGSSINNFDGLQMTNNLGMVYPVSLVGNTSFYNSTNNDNNDFIINYPMNNQVTVTLKNFNGNFMGNLPNYTLIITLNTIL
jgi:hypothetical protein